MGNDVRIGYVSSVDYAAGMVCVTYPDKNNSTTAGMPYFSFSGEYKMPEIQDKVLVVHQSNDSSSGVVLGRFWGEEQIPPVSGPGLYRKDFDKASYEQSQNGSLVLHAADLRFECSGGSITVAELIEMKRRLEALSG